MTLSGRQRLFLGLFFFTSGFTFSTWASRIPTIKDHFNLNEAELGTILLCMPVMSLLGLPFSGWLVSKFDSRVPLCFFYAINTMALACIGFSSSIPLLVASICLYAFSVRIFNISLNTQAVTIQKHLEKKNMGALHGLWSTGGIFGIGFSTLMVMNSVPLQLHFSFVAVIAFLIAVTSYSNLLSNDRASRGNKLILGKPDPYVMYLGLIVFCAAICEGGMFDWSGIYFHEVIRVETFTYGYLIFMTFMAGSRFISDRIISKLQMPGTYIMSALLIFTGIGIAIAFPTFWVAMLGFSFVGFGVASIVPMTFTLAGFSTKYSPGMAISIISTYSIAGMLLGPPLIGYLAHSFNLRVSFVTFAIMGLMIIPISQLFFRFKDKIDRASSSSQP